MNRLDREWEIKLDLLDAIAKSQHALAMMLESAAEVTAVAGVSAAVIREHVRVVEGMQAALLRTVTGIRWGQPKRGKPSPPWLRAAVSGKGSRRAGGGSR